MDPSNVTKVFTRSTLEPVGARRGRVAPGMRTTQLNSHALRGPAADDVVRPGVPSPLPATLDVVARRLANQALVPGEGCVPAWITACRRYG